MAESIPTPAGMEMGKLASLFSRRFAPPVRFFDFECFQQHGPLRFWVRLGSFFMHLRVFNNFPASFSASFSVRF